MLDILNELTPEARAYAKLQALETELRNFIMGQMTAAFGEGWEKIRVPNSIHLKWGHRLSEREKLTYQWARPVMSICELADFSDCKMVIINKENWDDLFYAVFKTPEYIGRKLDELYALRNEVMHMRAITDEAVRTLDHLISDILRMIRA